jgi:ribosome-associated translation inhibitor RaiA
MDRILQTFKEYDKEVLLAKKTLVIEELKKNKDLHESLVKLLDRIEKAIEKLKHINYDSD